MPRPKLPPGQFRVAAPMRMRAHYLAKLREIARAFGISPGEWVEAQLEQFMPKDTDAKKPPR